MTSAEHGTAAKVVFIHGACVRDGAWWWHRAAAELAERDIASSAPALPSCGETGTAPDATGPGLAEDTAAVRDHLTQAPAPTIVVAHSYGGIIAAGAVAGLDHVTHLLLISSYLPQAGERLADFGPSEPAPFLDVDPERGTFTAKPERFVDTFLQDCPEFGPDGATRLTAQSLSVIEAPVSSPGWQQVPTTYLVCTQDRGTSAERQRRYAERAGRVVEIDAGHHPFLSRPRDVAELIAELG